MTEQQINIIKYCFIGFYIFVGYLVITFVFDDDLMSKISIPTLVIVIVLAVLSGIIPLAWFDRMIKNIRSEEMQLAAGTFNWNYQQSLEMGFFKDLAKSLKIRGVHPLQSRFSEGVTGKINGWYFIVGEGEYSDGTDENSGVRQTFFCLRSDTTSFTRFGLEPESIFSKIHDVFGGFDINFASHPTFSKNYQLYGESEKEIRQLFQAKVLDYFEGREPLSVFSDGNQLVFYRKNKRVRPEQLEIELKSNLHLAELLSGTGTNKKTNDGREYKIISDGYW